MDQQDQPSSPSSGDEREAYQLNDPKTITQPIPKYKTPFFRIEQFRMTQLMHHANGDEKEMHHIVIPPTYCRAANSDEPSTCRMLTGRSLTRVVMDIPLPFVIELPAFRCSTHRRTTTDGKAKRASTYTHWFSHEFACKVCYDHLAQSGRPIGSIDGFNRSTLR